MDEYKNTNDFITELQNAQACGNDGLPIVKSGSSAVVDNGEKTTYKNYMLAAIDIKCRNNCSFCCNKHYENADPEWLEMAENFSKYDFLKTKEIILKLCRYMDEVVFCGGETLLYIDKIIEIIKDPRYQSNRNSIITSAPRKRFLSFVNYYLNGGKEDLGNFKIYLSRHGIEDNENQRIYDTKDEILLLDDIINLPDEIKKIITIFVTSFEDGISEANDIIKYIDGMVKTGIANIQFNSPLFLKDGLERQIPAEYKKAAEMLTKLGYQFHSHIAGFGDTAYTYDYYYKISDEGKRINIWFKTYLDKESTAKQSWRDSKKRMFDFLVLPNGEVYTGFQEKLKSQQFLNKTTS